MHYQHFLISSAFGLRRSLARQIILAESVTQWFSTMKSIVVKLRIKFYYEAFLSNSIYLYFLILFPVFDVVYPLCLSYITADSVIPSNRFCCFVCFLHYNRFMRRAFALVALNSSLEIHRHAFAKPSEQIHPSIHRKPPFYRQHLSHRPSDIYKVTGTYNCVHTLVMLTDDARASTESLDTEHVHMRVCVVPNSILCIHLF